MKKSEKFSLQKTLRSFVFAFSGIKNLINAEQNARIHTLAMFIAIVLGVVLNIERMEWVAIVIVIGLVFLAELFNTAIERLCDEVDPEWNAGIKRVKDYSAAAVLLSAIISLIVGGIIFIPVIVECIGP